MDVDLFMIEPRKLCCLLFWFYFAWYSVWLIGFSRKVKLNLNWSSHLTRTISHKLLWWAWKIGTAKFEVEKFTGSNDFGLWRVKMRAWLVHQGLDDALKGIWGLPASILSDQDKKALMEKAHSAIILSLGDKVLRKVSKEQIIDGVWQSLKVCIWQSLL